MGKTRYVVAIICSFLVMTPSAWAEGGIQCLMDQFNARLSSIDHHPLDISQIHYTEYGSKKNPTVVMLHGLGSSSESFDELAPRLADKYRVVTLDLRGHGKTEASGDSYFAETLAQDVHAVMLHLGDPEITILGHSLGSRVAIKYAERYPTKIRGVVVEDHELIARPHRLQLDYDQRARGLAKLPKSFQSIEALKSAYEPFFDASDLSYLLRKKVKLNPDGSYSLAISPVALVRFRNEANFQDFSQELSHLKDRNIPISVLAADPAMDTDLSAAGLAQLQKFVPRERIHFFKNAGHSVHRDDQEGFFKTLSEILATQPLPSISSQVEPLLLLNKKSLHSKLETMSVKDKVSLLQSIRDEGKNDSFSSSLRQQLENDLHNDKYASQAMSSYLANSKLTPQVREEAKKRLLRNQYVKRLEAMEGNILESLSRSAPNERLEWARRILSRTEDPGNKDACSDICIDALFGLRTLDEEAALSKKGLELHEQHRGEKIWIQGHPESILTRYSIFRAVEEQLKPAPGSTFVDLGSGYGRLGFYLSAKRPDLRFIGYELLPDRVRAASAAAKELGLPENRLHFVEKNLGDPKFQPEPADYYYMFNPFSEKTLEKVMSDLQKISKSKRVRLVMMDYGLPPMLARQAPWLRKVERIETGSIPVVVYESI